MQSLLEIKEDVIQVIIGVINASIKAATTSKGKATKQ